MLFDLTKIYSYLEFIPNFFLKRKKVFWLVVASALLVFFLILLNNLKIVPLQWSDFIFFTLLVLALAFYRPSWTFILFLSTIPLENINLTPLILGVTLRPYQFFGALTIVAILIKIITQKLNFRLQKLKAEDYLIIFMLVSGLVTALLGNPIFRLANLKLIFILLSFVGFYFLSKNYLQNKNDIKKMMPFLFSTSGVVIIYGLWQNIRFSQGLSSFEVMLGRPNATFTEADWLGVYLVLILSLSYALFFYFAHTLNTPKNIRARFFVISNYVLLLAVYMLLILTVSRSAWLAGVVVTGLFLLIVLTNLQFNFQKWKGKETLIWSGKLFTTFLVSLALIFLFKLTIFQLFNRVQSTQTGLQKITVACEISNKKDFNLPTQIENVSELKKYGCRFIKLEEIKKAKKAGEIVTQTYRPDPNVVVRGQIYQKSWQAIKEHPLLGIGWGSIGPMLGQDEQGNYLNASNIFLETWLGLGMGGFLALVVLWIIILFRAIKSYRQANGYLAKSWNLFIIISWVGWLIVNLFNAGMLLGVFWLWLGVVVGEEK